MVNWSHHLRADYRPLNGAFISPILCFPPKKVNEIVLKIAIINMISYNLKKNIKTQISHFSQRVLLKEVYF